MLKVTLVVKPQKNTYSDCFPSILVIGQETSFICTYCTCLLHLTYPLLQLLTLKDNADVAISWQHIIDGPVPLLQILGKCYLLTTLESSSETKELAGYEYSEGIALQDQRCVSLTSSNIFSYQNMNALKTSFLSSYVQLHTAFSQSKQLLRDFIPWHITFHLIE